MKKIIYLFIILISFSSYGQQIAISLDYETNFTATPDMGYWVKDEGFSQRIAIGGVYSMEMREKLNLELGANFGTNFWFDMEGESSTLDTGISSIAKYYLSEAFSLKGGVGFEYRFGDRYQDPTGEYLRKRGALYTYIGVGWDITEKFIISTGGTIQLTNSSKIEEGAIRKYSIGIGLEYFIFDTN